ncbi:MAG: methylated-DNA--[protein]-cysteine S-methyltransferase [Clostridiales bacterium]|nr:methylated-DNA--[protein]-cysteine S-methyltransferase [Clostridiales bacterium]
MDKVFKTYYSSPIGIVEITGTKEGVTSIIFAEGEAITDGVPDVLKDAYNQLDEYFKGKRKVFDLRLSLGGTEFQRKVWMELMNIPSGEVLTYRDIANKLGNSNAVRAVGNANGKNPISIVVPCHRVIGSNGKLTGYAGGLERKAWLLKHEKDMMRNV